MKHVPYSAASSYQKTQISQTDPVSLIVILYDGALSRIVQARQRFHKGDFLYGGLALTKTQAIVAELRKSLNHEEGGEIAANLDRLYGYLHDLLVSAIRENRVEPLDEASALLSELRSAWAEIAKQERGGASTLDTRDLTARQAGPPPEAYRLAVKA